MSLGQPWWLLTLAVVPVAVALYLADEQRRRAQARSFAGRGTAPSAVRSTPGWRRHVPMAFYVVALACLGLALAKPQATVAVDVEQAAVVLVTDHSGSMQATDVAPSRLVAARDAARLLLEGVPKRLRVGLVQFNGRAEVLQPLTTDRLAIRAGIDAMRPSGGTATGDGLMAGLSLVRPGGRGDAPAAIVLLSDGASVRGRDPIEVARTARRLRVPVSTIALGTASGTIDVRRRDGSIDTQPVPPDTAAMRRIAQITGGETFEATDAARLNSAFERLGSKIGRRDEQRELTAAAAGGALLFILIGAGAGLALSGRFA